MARSSGTKAIPRRAIWWDSSPPISAPWKRMVPLFLRRTPMIDFRVVLFPAPLRPIKLTTSPARTVKPTPRKAWL
jgi:hypothetical protein